MSTLVSPQFHCKYDDLFETVTGLNVKQQPLSLWQEKACLTLPSHDEKKGEIKEQTESSQGDDKLIEIANEDLFIPINEDPF